MIILASLVVHVVCVSSVDTGLNGGVPIGLTGLPAGLRVFLEKKVVSCGQMVVLIVLDRSLDRLIAEAEGSFHLEKEFIINCSCHSMMVIVLIFWLV